ncbi:MAG: isoprenylcysteine carboxylmethyltransferase family protein [Ardenticatenaceae bacterium]|nr:isoprenylcysteine carboxylmethyltransferase family protein [Ardenticatenaceae bacterium]
MWLDRVERWVRRAGALGVLIFIGAMAVGLWRGFRHPKGRTTGPVPAFVRAFSGGSLAFYLPASALGFGLMYLLWRPLRLTLSTSARAGALILGALLYFPGLALMLWGRLALGEMYNVSTSVGVQLYADHRLVTCGPFTLMRHPMYVGGQLAELGALLIYRTWATLLIAALNIPVLWLRARREEQALAAEFGEQWVAYSQRVPAWISRLSR